MTPEDAAGFWLVPVLCGRAACGFAQVELDGRVTALAAFGAGPDDEASWPAASFFQRPPAAVLREVRHRHPELAGARPVLTYDRSPARWVWRLAAPAASVEAYISPGGWYARAPGGPLGQGREG
jgi:hypothetical protein